MNANPADHAGPPYKGRTAIDRATVQQRRQSHRLPGYDYSQAGAYYVTQCIESRLCVLGEVVDEQTRLFAPGEMVQYWWCELASKYRAVELKEFVVMPNHIHGILV